MSIENNVKIVRDGLRKFNRRAGVLKPDPYGLGLSLSQCSTLIDISRFGSLRSNELVHLLHLEKSSVSRLISVLENKKFITLTNDPNDGRSKILTLTRSGERAVEEINHISNQSVLEVFHCLDSKDQKTISLAFEKLAQIIESMESSSR
jgi:DNA-binding MarR family transcriptional regulator